VPFSENAHRVSLLHAVNLRLELFHRRAVRRTSVCAEPFRQFPIFGFEARQRSAFSTVLISNCYALKVAFPGKSRRAEFVSGQPSQIRRPELR